MQKEEGGVYYERYTQHTRGRHSPTPVRLAGLLGVFVFPASHLGPRPCLVPVNSRFLTLFTGVNTPACTHVTPPHAPHTCRRRMPRRTQRCEDGLPHPIWSSNSFPDGGGHFSLRVDAQFPFCRCARHLTHGAFVISDRHGALVVTDELDTRGLVCRRRLG